MSDGDDTSVEVKKTAPLVTKISVSAHDDAKDTKPETEKPDAATAVVITKRAILKAPQTVADADSSAVTGETPAQPEAAAKLSVNAGVVKPLVPSADVEPPKVDVKPSADAGPKADKSTVSDPAQLATAAAKPADASPAKSPDDNADKPNDAAANETEETDESNGANEDEKAAQKTEAEINAAAEAKAKHDETIQKLIDSKQYYLPVNAVEKRKTKQFTVLGILLSVVLLLAWADIALDAGLIQINGIKPVTHFFSN